MPNVLMLHFVGQQACSAPGFRYLTHTRAYARSYTHTCTQTAGLLRSMLALTRQLMAKKWTWPSLNGIHTWPTHAHCGPYTHLHTRTFRGTYTHDNMRIRINKFTRTKLQHFGISNWSCVYISMHTSICVCSVCVSACIRVRCVCE